MFLKALLKSCSQLSKRQKVMLTVTLQWILTNLKKMAHPDNFLIKLGMPTSEISQKC